MFRVKGATRGQVFLLGLCLWLAGPVLFHPFNTANHHWPQFFADGTLFTGAVLALTAETPKEGSKSDKVDARKLAELLRSGMLRPVYHGENGLRALRELGRSYQTIGKEET